MLALRSCAYSMYTCIYAIYAVANITIDPAFDLGCRSEEEEDDGENRGFRIYR